MCIDKQMVLEKEIDLIQGCINRMSQNSFVIKGWLISLIAVVLGLLPETFNIRILCIIGFLTTICFWYLDGFFLKIEKLYRWKYEWILKNRNKSNDFYYNLDPYNKEMWVENEDEDVKKEPNIFRIMFTKTLLAIYAPILIAVILLFINTFTSWF